MESYGICRSVTELFNLAQCPQGSFMFVARDRVFFLFKDGIIFYFSHLPHFAYSCVNGLLGCFHSLAVVNVDAVNVRECALTSSGPCLWFFWRVPGGGVAGPRGFAFRGTVVVFSVVAAPLYSPANSVQRFRFSSCSPHSFFAFFFFFL